MPTLPNVQNMGARPVGQPRRLVLPPEAPSVQGAQSLAATPGQVGQQLEQQANRMFTRQDAVARVKSATAYNEYAAETLRNFEVERDLTDLNTVKEYGTLLSQKQNELLASHKGSPESRADLEMRFQETRSRYSGEIAGRSLKAQQDLADNYMEQARSEISSQVYDGNMSYDDAAAAWENEVTQMSGVYPTAYEGALKVGGKAEIAQTQLQGMLDRGNYADAEEFMLREDISRVMTPAQQRQVRSRVTIQQVAEEREQQALQRQQRSIEAFLGRPLSQNEKLGMVGMAPKPRNATLADKIAEAEAVLGRPLTDQQIEQAYLAELGVEEAGGTLGEGAFGNSLQGRALNIMNDLGPGYAAGLNTPEDDRKFEAAIIEYTQPKSFTDPTTGIVTRSRPELPPTILSYLESRPIGELGAPVDTTVPEAYSSALDVGSGETVYNEAGEFTGIVPAFGRLLSRVPVVGDLLPEQVNEFNRVAQDTSLLFKNVGKVLRENPRFAEAERKEIMADLAMDPAALDTPSRFRSSLQGIDDNLAFREQVARDMAENDRTSRVERQKAMDTLALIVPLRERLGVPQRVNSVEELAASMANGNVKPGQPVRLPDGSIFEAPADPSVLLSGEESGGE